MNDQDQQDQGSFLTGLSFGVIAGAVGYFLFATDKGHKITKDLAKEWEAAKEHLAQEGVIESSDVSVRDLVRNFASMAAHSVGMELPSESKATKKSSHKSIKPVVKKKSATTKFKGT